MRHCDVNKILNHRSPNLHFLDCSMSPKAEELFSVRSLPNSKLIKMHNIHEPDAPLPFTLPSKSHFINIMSEIGIHMGDICICYGQENFISASRMAFILSAYGNGESTYVLDGGLDACKEGNLPFVQGAQIGDYGIQDGYFGDQFTLNSSMFASFIQVKDVVVNGGDAIIDCRTSETFNAPPTSGRKYSFIPRAINLSSLMFIGENHKLKDIKEIEQILLDNGIKKDMDLIVHCQAGIGATVLYNILDSMGYKIRLYDGSWSEYGNDESTIELEKYHRTGI